MVNALLSSRGGGSTQNTRSWSLFGLVYGLRSRRRRRQRRRRF